MRRGPILQRIAPFMTFPCRKIIICGINLPFGRLSPSVRQVAHVLLTRPPLVHTRRCSLARLACVKHAASVHPEPGSNSQFKKFESKLITHFKNCWSKFISKLIFLLCLIFKDLVALKRLIYLTIYEPLCQQFFNLFFQNL